MILRFRFIIRMVCTVDITWLQSLTIGGVVHFAHSRRVVNSAHPWHDIPQLWYTSHSDHFSFYMFVILLQEKWNTAREIAMSFLLH